MKHLENPQQLKRHWKIFFQIPFFLKNLEKFKKVFSITLKYCISSYSCCKNCSFFNLEIVANSNSCHNISIFYLINWNFASETIQGRKLYEEIQYLEKVFQERFFSWKTLGKQFERKYFSPSAKLIQMLNQSLQRPFVVSC